MKKYGLLLLSTALLAGASHAFAQGASPPAERRVFFGDLHLHTALSYDAWAMGTKLLPDQSYKFSRGETITVPAAQVGREEALSGDVQARRTWPLDFQAVTDHSEMMGAMRKLDDPNSAFAQTALGKKFIATPQLAGQMMYQSRQGAPVSPDIHAKEAERESWDIVVKAANDNYEPGKFTTFIAYEWSSTPGGATLHRNVIFDADHAPLPFTCLDSSRPEDLWKYLESVRRQGIPVIAIPHNSNVSSGLDFDWNDSSGKPIDEAYAQERALNEPLVEIAQNKGQSDTIPEISPNDEFADFEIYGETRAGATVKPNNHGSYIREAFGRGLVIQAKVGANPFKYGIIGDTDIHNGMSTQDENAMAGAAFGIDPNTMSPNPAAVRREMSAGAGSRILQFSSGGLTGVWAEQNTRDSIFAALQRKETFGTSGVRIRVRMFAGWNYDSKLMGSSNWAESAYANGVAMGSDLPARSPGAGAPKFALWAMKDADGASLDRIQVIKIWLEGGDYKEKIFDVALSGGRRADATGKAPAVGNTVDLTTGKYTNTIGATELSALWQDPEFDPAKPAVYYTRVLQIPTPRWSTLLAIKDHIPIPGGTHATIQERAWSSPIWYTPAKS